MRDIKKVGDYVALVHFHKEVTVEIPVKVVSENAPAEEEVKAEAPVEEAVPAAVEEEAPAAEEEAPAAE
jgi:large subunit ribosomal protein L9